MEVEYPYKLDNMDPEEFSDSEKHQNYCQIVRTVEFLQNGGRVTEDWMTEHIELIKMYREWISDFSEINEEQEDKEFRKCCEETETLIQYLCNMIRSTGHFDPKVYLMFVQHMKKICDLIFEADELEECMKMLAM